MREILQIALVSDNNRSRYSCVCLFVVDVCFFINNNWHRGVDYGSCREGQALREKKA
jgi:hypothetical protein